MSIVAVVANGRIRDRNLTKERLVSCSFVIAANGGSRHCRDLGISPDMVVGDFDSLGAEQIVKFEQEGVRLIRHPVRKDQTDLELALTEAVRLTPKAIYVFGGLGGLLDHTFANIFLLVSEAFKDIDIRFLDAGQEILLVRGQRTIQAAEGSRLSLLSLSNRVENVFIKGVEWPLAGATLLLGSTHGVSNRVIDSKVEISVGAGLLLCMVEHVEDGLDIF